jgi:hypothetical protein
MVKKGKVNRCKQKGKIRKIKGRDKFKGKKS